MSEEERLQLENELLMTCSKAQAINKYIDEFEECSRLSELWCKSQQENKQLKEKLNCDLQWALKYDELFIENNQLKEVIEEVRKAVDYMIGNVDISEIHGTKLKQILDKVGDK